MNMPQQLEEIKKIISKCGVVGAGGGGFPSHLKLDIRCKTILLNCTECEPLIQVDSQLLGAYTPEILLTLNLLAEVLDANVVVAVKKSFTAAISAIENKLDKYPRIRLVLLDEIYPAGDEIVLVYEALGIVIPPGTLPIEAGYVIFNVETVYNMYNALEYEQPVTHKWVTIVGEVERPVTARFPIGTTLKEAVKRAGEITTQSHVFIVDGVMMGCIASPSDEIKKTTNCLLVLPSDHTLALRGSNKQADLNRIASACCQCRTCTDMCPRNLLGHPIQPHRIMRALSARDAKADVYGSVMYCSMCGVCEVIACPQSLAPRAMIKIFKTALSKAGVKPKKREAAPVPCAREGRLVHANRLKMRLGLAKYDLEAPMEAL
ncbi:MAG: SLBB domain-containing protein [Firmicutes bacterium]|nr:SLBB domain-containing protein [Bacillota bacterium]